MIKLNAGVSRKVGEPNYGSRGASVNVELELESPAAQDVELLHDRIRKLFTLARDAVNAELGLNGNGRDSLPPANGSQTPAGERPATEPQLRAITAICERLGLDPHDQARLNLSCPLEELTLPEASRLIDQLKIQDLPGKFPFGNHISFLIVICSVRKM